MAEDMRNASLETQVFSNRIFQDLDAKSKAADQSDLGFGSHVASRSKRLLNADGSFNVIREGVGLSSWSFYHFCLNTTWLQFLSSLFLSYVIINLFFASLYYLCGADALVGIDNDLQYHRLIECFFFSVQTFATIGYGRISPNGIPSNILVTIESLVGLLCFALATGLFFARFSKPTAKILYSKFSVVAPYKHQTAFMFRIANLRKNQILNLEAKVIFSRLEQLDGQIKRKFYELPLERQMVMYFPLSWTVVHPISTESPLHNAREADLRKAEAEFLVSLSGIDDTFNQQVYSSTSYKYDELVWDAKFVNILEDQENGAVKINLKRINEIERTK
ncbi:MAG: hypothetical protein KBC84_10435 [Proteobacteria bacterium]|nr:hypothetical protein [Pseudomonadota bacterium]